MSRFRWQVELRRSIHDFSPDEWNSFIEAGDLQATHAFVRACQESGIAETDYRFLMIRDEDGPACVAALSIMPVPLELLAPRWARGVIRGARRVRRSFLKVPVLFGGLPVSFGHSCLRIRRGAPAAELIRELCAVMDQIGRELDVELQCVKELDAHEAAEFRAFTDHGFFPAPSLPYCTLELPWTSLHEYLSAMRADYRRQAMQTLATRSRGGWSVRRAEHIEPYLPGMFKLYEQVMNRAEHQLERLPLGFFKKLGEHLRAETHAVLLEQNGALKAFSLMLNAGGVSTFLLTGYDDRVDRAAQLYPNLVLAVVADAIADEAKRLDMGQTSYALKMRLGAAVRPRTLFLRGRSAWRHRLLKTSAPLLFPEQNFTPRRVFSAHEPTSTNRPDNASIDEQSA